MRKVLREAEQLLQLSLVQVLLEEKIGEALSGEPSHVLLQLGFIAKNLTQVNKNMKVLVFLSQFNSMMELLSLNCSTQ